MSQLNLFHCPASSFIGYFTRRSPWQTSRIAAPLAQWPPRLIGDSKVGSWLIQTPFCTSAVTVQPTEQCVQRFLMRLTSPVAAIGAAASAFCTRPSGTVERAASPPAPTPDRRRNVRRSIVPPVESANTRAKREGPALREFLLVSIRAPPLKTSSR